MHSFLSSLPCSHPALFDCSRPFKGQCDQCATATGAALLGDLRENPSSELLRQFPADLLAALAAADDEAKEQLRQRLSSLVLPAPLQNQFLRRLLAALTEESEEVRQWLLREVLGANQDLLLSACALLPCRLDLAQLAVSQRPLLQRCPAGGHLVLFAASGPAVVVSLFDGQQTAQFFRPLLNLTAAGADGSLAAALSFEPRPFAAELKPAGRVVSLAAGEFLVVPGHLLAQVELAEGGAGAGGLWLQCLYDAANLLGLHNGLLQLAAVSPAQGRLARYLFELLLANDLAAAFESPKFTIFDKQPRDLSLAYFLSAELTAAPSGPAAASDTAASSNNRKNRKKDAGSLQFLVQWKQSLLPLLLPRPAAIAPLPDSPGRPLAASEYPRIAAVGRTAVELSWRETLFLPPDNDPTRYGYRLLVCDLGPAGPGAAGPVFVGNQSFLRPLPHDGQTAAVQFVVEAAAGPTDAAGAAQCEERDFLADRKGGPGQLTVRRQLVADLSAETRKRLTLAPSALGDLEAEVVGESLAVSLAVDQLRPARRYQLKAALLYGQQRGPFSDWSPVFSTRPLQAPSVPLAPLPAPDLEADLARPPHSQPYLVADTRPLLARGQARYELQNPRLFHWHKYAALGGELFFRPPRDDGGRPVLGYGLYGRATGSFFPSEWLFLGSYVAVDAVSLFCFPPSQP